jgi:hypothetical protein
MKPPIQILAKIAEQAHNVNNVWTKEVGNDTRPEWHTLSQEDKEHYIHAVANAIDSKLESPQEAHKQWSTWMLAQGWEFGEQYDREGKKHPNLRPYDQLPETEKVKDILFIAVCKPFY